ncbi:MAG: helix-turn-helix domain-containing protein [Opitutales bacterium]
MQSIGERLEEARKRKGISLREAAEATKIRSDFLGYIEQNKMDFDLPEIYKRGFLKNYARYLRLDVDKIMTDYNAQQLSHSRLGKKGGAEWFGQMEIKKTEASEPAEGKTSEESATYGRIEAQPTSIVRTEETPEEEEEADKTFYMKIGLVFIGVIALVFVVAGLIMAILGSDNASNLAVEPEYQNSSEVATSEEPTSTDGVDTDSITLIASGNVYVLVKQQLDDTELYRNTMSEGESVTLEKDGPVDILFTAGENLVIEQGAERFRPNASGTAKISIQ